MWTALGRAASVAANHQTELDTTKACLVNWNKRKSDAAKKAPSAASGSGEC